MKRLLNLVLVLVFVTSVLAGCGAKETSAPQKSEEELRAEIKAEMEAEKKEKEALEAKIRAEIEAENQEKEDSTESKDTKEENPVKEEKNDLSKGYTYKIDNGVLKLTYNNTGNEIALTLANNDTSDMKKWIGEIINVNKSHNGKRLYFETPAWATSNAVHYVDLETLKVKFFSDGWFVQNVGQAPYTNSVIIQKSYIDGDNGRTSSYIAIASTGEELCNLGANYDKNNLVAEISKAIEADSPEFNTNGQYNLKGYTNESINGTQVNYDEYIAVIIPMYNGVNKDKLKSNSYNIGANQLTEVNFAIFGKMENIQILYTTNGMSEEYKITKVGTRENEIITIKTEFPTDFANILVRGTVMGGEGYANDIEFTIDDMRDLSEYKPYMIKY